MQDAPAFRAIHDALLARSAALLKHLPAPAARLAHFRRTLALSLPGAATLGAFFASEAALGADAAPDVLQAVYEVWRRRDAGGAALAWAAWLVRRGRGKDAAEVVGRARAEVAGDDARRAALEEGWRAVLGELEQGGARMEEDGDEDGDGDATMADA